MHNYWLEWATALALNSPIGFAVEER